MDRDVKISVIIPAYNSQSTIVDCIESVIKQTYSVFEIIVINDGSTDNTLKTCIEYKRFNTINNLKILSQNNSGPSKARNLGIHHASGNWIAFLDADDVWLPNKIEKQIKVVKERPDIAIIGTLIYKNGTHYTNKIYSLSFKMMLYKNYLLTSTVLVNKKIVMDYFFDENQKYSEDYKLWLHILFSHPGCIINEGLIQYRINKKSDQNKSLSSNYIRMEKSELKNYLDLYKTHKINTLTLSLVSFWSIIKFSMRFSLKRLHKIRIRNI